MFECIKKDVHRLTDGNVTARVIIRGLLSQGFQAILVYRLFRWLRLHNIPAQPFRFIFERFIEITTGISIPVECEIGAGLRIHHFGGIMFHSSARLGENCTIYHNVTIGDRGGSGGAATVGDNVLIGAGAKLVGEIVIGSNCKIGANTTVTCNVPPDSVVTSAPAVVRPRSRPAKEKIIE